MHTVSLALAPAAAQPDHALVDAAIEELIGNPPLQIDMIDAAIQAVHIEDPFEDIDDDNIYSEQGMGDGDMKIYLNGFNFA